MSIVLTFLMTSALYGILAWLAFRKVSRHLQGNPEAIKSFSEHVLLPLLGRDREQDRAADTDPQGPPPAKANEMQESRPNRI